MSYRMTQVPREILSQLFARNLEAATAVTAIYGRILDNPEIARAAVEDLTQAAEDLQALARILAAYLTPDNNFKPN